MPIILSESFFLHGKTVRFRMKKFPHKYFTTEKCVNLWAKGLQNIIFYEDDFVRYSIAIETLISLNLRPPQEQIEFFFVIYYIFLLLFLSTSKKRTQLFFILITRSKKKKKKISWMENFFVHVVSTECKT